MTGTACEAGDGLEAVVPLAPSEGAIASACSGDPERSGCAIASIKRCAHAHFGGSTRLRRTSVAAVEPAATSRRAAARFFSDIHPRPAADCCGIP